MEFMGKLKETLNGELNLSVTENGAVGYRTTGKELLDVNFAISSMRNMDETQIIDKFTKAFYENKLLAVKWLFFARDIRGGVGERRLFRICMKYLAKNHTIIAKAIIDLIPEYGRYDDLWCLLDVNDTMREAVIDLINKQLKEDIENMANNKPVSLIAKWLPSVNASSKGTRKLAQKIAFSSKYTPAGYRKTLSKLRSYLKVTETSMSKGEWEKIDYSAVPSKANLIYNNAFLRHDEERRRDYLDKLQKGETKINAGVLFPHDIVKQYRSMDYYNMRVNPYDITLEEMWKALPDYVNGNGNTICIADGSYSMTDTIHGTFTMALDVATALAIYFSERCTGQFKNKYITFSENPVFVDLSNGKSLKEKIEIAYTYDEVADTNIEAVFDLILLTAIKNKTPQNELPQNILILSDMEFNNCVCTSTGYGVTKRLFEVFAQKYAEHGYKLPRLVFWNILSRTGTIPVTENDLGVALVSGFSPVVVKMVLSNSIDPYDCLLEQLNSERYAAVEDRIMQIL